MLYWEREHGVAGRLKSPEAVAALLVHEQTHVFQIEKHASQPAYEISVYAWNYFRLRDAFRDYPVSAEPYFTNDPWEPWRDTEIFNPPLPKNTPERPWADSEWDLFKKTIVESPHKFAYRYLPTEIQAYNIELDARKFFKNDDVSSEADGAFKKLWTKLFP
ncbi:MAG: hypothetical protein N3A38_14230 [Planctomycetota bacterium]|nr:hypothetical protein [Planctomycetota bacterium]